MITGDCSDDQENLSVYDDDSCSDASDMISEDYSDALEILSVYDDDNCPDASDMITENIVMLKRIYQFMMMIIVQVLVT